MFWLLCYICQFFYIIFGERWSIEWWIWVGWQHPKVRRILREGWVVGHAIGNWRGNWDGTFHHFLGRFLCGFGCIPSNWQILVPWLWLHTTLLFYILPSHTRKGYIRGWLTRRNAILIRNTIRDGGITLLTVHGLQSGIKVRALKDIPPDWILEPYAVRSECDGWMDVWIDGIKES